MTQEELNKIIEAHKHYLAQDCEGWEYMRANLSEANLRGVNFYGADLSMANLSEADLRGADICHANLYGATLSYTNLRGADLCGTNLREARLSDADLSYARLGDADLSDADLSYARFRGASLCYADLSGANLRDADLNGAHLRGANLNGIKYNDRTSCFALICPEKGDFIAWKKVCNVIVKIKVPAKAKRSSATTRKCRCEFAKVLGLQNLDGTPYNDNEIINYNKYGVTHYKVGKIVRPDSWDEDRWSECSHGIHFFMTRDEAVRY